MQHSLNINFQARYFTEGNKETAKEAWIVLHGYGQLAAYFIRKFSVLAKHDIYVVAPEALSHFYLEELPNHGMSRIGASWMTRENRLVDIENYTNYLNEVGRTALHGMNIPVTLLGFSQGAATVTRWALDGKINFTRLILWAGVFPPDIDYSKSHEILKNKETVLVYGNEDPFLSDQRFIEIDRMSGALGISPQKIQFEGKHEIHEPTLKRLAKLN